MPSPSILFITRGFGMGHATRDMAIAAELQKLSPDLRISFASYADGLKAFQLNQVEVLDLQLSPLGKNFERVPRIGRLIQETQPDLVVADEELFALPLCEIFDIPSVFVTNWLVGENVVSHISFLLNTQHVIMADFEDSFMVPRWLTAPVSFVGPICREFPFQDRTKQALRQELGLRSAAKLIIATAGGGDIADFWFFHTCAYALSRLSEDVQAILVVGSLYHTFEFAQYNLAPHVQFTDHLPDLPQYFAASDLVITRGGHTTLWELAILGTPSLCIPHPPFLDPLNERYAFNMQRRGTTVVFRERELDVDRLAVEIQSLLQEGAALQQMSARGQELTRQQGTRPSAQIILEHLHNGRSRCE